MSLMQNHPSRPCLPRHHQHYMQISQPSNSLCHAVVCQPTGPRFVHCSWTHSHDAPASSSSSMLTSHPNRASPQTRIRLSIATSTPRMLQHLANRDPLLDITIEHQPHQIDALLAHNPRHAQIVVHDLVNAIERILLVDDGVQQNAERPYILLFATIGAACEDFGGGVVWRVLALF